MGKPSTRRSEAVEQLGNLLLLGDSTIASAKQMEDLNPAYYTGADCVLDHSRLVLRDVITAVDASRIARTINIDDTTLDIGTPEEFNDRKVINGHLDARKHALIIVALGTNDFREPQNRKSRQKK